MRIAILDHLYDRVIVAEVPEWIQAMDKSTDTIGECIVIALGLHGNCDYMIGNIGVAIDVGTLNSGRGYGDNTRRLDEFGGNFKEDFLKALEDAEAI